MPDPRVYVRSQNGVVRSLNHFQRPYVGTETAPDSHPLAEEYLRDVASIYSVDGQWLNNLQAQPGDSIDAAVLTEMRSAEDKSILGVHTVTFVQTHYSLPIWEAGVSIIVQGNPLSIGNSYSSIHPRVNVAPAPIGAPCMAGNIDANEFKNILGPNVNSIPELEDGLNNLVINERPRFLIYQYDPANRIDTGGSSGVQPSQAVLHTNPPTLPLPAVPVSIEPMRHYVVSEVLFSMAVPNWGTLNWRAFVEVETCAILYLRAFVACCTGDVFPVDPPTLTGKTWITPASPNGDLAQAAHNVALLGLCSVQNATTQKLKGEFVEISELQAPLSTPPIATGPPFNFSYAPRCQATDFSAVNAYYHCDAAFRMVEQWMTTAKSTIKDYFKKTGLPMKVDHLAQVPNQNTDCFGGYCSNAATLGDPQGKGAQSFWFAMADTQGPVGMATDKRAVLHEFGHALLYETLNCANFKFAHSAGDSLAAISSDPLSKLTDHLHRFATFPWVEDVSNPNSRRHDRKILDGWGWDADNDNHDYLSEQILTTTLFRAYRSAGGDALSNDPAEDLARRQQASECLLYLIVMAIGILGSGIVSQPTEVGAFADLLEAVDRVSETYAGRTGGTLHKVIDWSFRKQGLCRPTNAPQTAEGSPPKVDVYIDDGRAGEYQYQYDFWNTKDIWNRLKADGGASHQTPITKQTNYIYVRIKNRGTQAAKNTSLRVYSADPGTGFVWKGPSAKSNTGWTELTAVPYKVEVIHSQGGEVIAGPIPWTPKHPWHECLFAMVSDDIDLSNVDPYVDKTGTTVTPPCGTLPTPHWQLVPHDNNIAQRNLVPVPSGNMGKNLFFAFFQRTFHVHNPYPHSSNVVVEWTLPYFLRERGWSMELLDGAVSSFRLPAYGSKKITLRLNRGKRFSRSDVLELRHEQKIEFRTRIDGQIVGGMTYMIDPFMKMPQEWRKRAEANGQY